MKKSAVLFALATLTSFAQADVNLQVVSDYSLAADAALWVKPKNDQIPNGLLNRVQVAKPTSSYSSLFPKHFLQQDDFVVCFINCKTPDQFKLRGSDLTKAGKQSDWDLVEQHNVYYWLASFTDYLEKNFGFNYKWHLQVNTNHLVKGESGGGLMKNNAFFNPMNNTLSFLPASKSVFFKLMGGRINRSGFDPSVVLHEASHFFFEHLFSNPVNTEIKGLNEGFADYMANTFLDNPKVGLVMLQGKALRDSSSVIDSSGRIKIYEPRLEVHDLGERVSLALWRSRELAQDKIAFDLMVIEGIQQLAQNKFATVHDFKKIMLDRIRYAFPSQDAATAQATWELIFPGAPTEVASLDFMDRPRVQKSFFGFKVRQIIGEQMAESMGVSEIKSNFTMIDTQKVSEDQMAVLVASENEDQTVTKPYWLVVDDKKHNIIAAFGVDKRPVTEEREATEVESIAQQVLVANDFIKDFGGKLRTFTQLANGQGDLEKAYKITKSELSEEIINVNGQRVQGQKLVLKVKPKLLVNLLSLGNLPEFNEVVLFSVPVAGPKGLPTLNDQTVIGFRLVLKSGSGQEVILNRFGN